MTNIYDLMARVLQAVAEAGGDVVEGYEVRDRTGLAENEILTTFAELARRRWIRLDRQTGQRAELLGQGHRVAGMDPAELLAGDLGAWLRDGGKKRFEVVELPAELREDQDLLILAMQHLADANAIKLFPAHRGGPAPGALVLPGLRTYDFGPGRSLASIRIQQNVAHGDIVGGDKNTNTGPGALVTGSGNTVVTADMVLAGFRELVEGLTADELVVPESVTALRAAAEPDRSPIEVARLVDDAVSKSPSLRARLGGWLADLGVGVAGSALYDGILFALK